jgi:hypothetical protein
MIESSHFIKTQAVASRPNQFPNSGGSLSTLRHAANSLDPADCPKTLIRIAFAAMRGGSIPTDTVFCPLTLIPWLGALNYALQAIQNF